MLGCWIGLPSRVLGSRRLLRFGGERRGEEGEDASDEGAPVHYSIT
jgi:hypothetical protein